MEIVGYLIIVFFVIVYLVWVYRLAVAYEESDDIFLDSLPNISVSIVVAMRNEESNIVNLLNAIYSQLNTPKQTELILVDDYSTDNTLEKIENWKQSHHDFEIRVICMKDFPDEGNGKKAAISKAISLAKFDYIITTDADCTMGVNWLNAMCNYFLQKKVTLLAGPIMLHANTFFGRLQHLEMMLIQALTYATFKVDKPLMCNAANIMFGKDDYLSLNQESLHTHVASGDDLFFMLALKQKKMPLGYALCSACIVSTNAINNFTVFVNQRIRWASKIKYVNDKDILMTGIIVMIMNLMMLSFFGMAITGLSTWYYFLILFALKFFCDAILLNKYLQKMEIEFEWFPIILVFEMLFPFYNLLIMVLSVFGKYKWKGRGY